MHRLLDLCAHHNVKSTFFVLGSVAEAKPAIVREIHAAGHEVASHGYGHQSVWSMSPAQFRADLKRSCDILEGITGAKVLAYRAPSFSLREETLGWYYEALEEAGIRCSSSVFPGRTFLYGIPGFPECVHYPVVEGRRVGVLEVPLPRVRLLGRDLGLYVRLFPEWVLRRRIERENRAGRPVTLYVHPREIDPGQPRLRLRWPVALIHYWGIAGCERKLDALLGSLPGRFGRTRDLLSEAGREFAERHIQPTAGRPVVLIPAYQPSTVLPEMVRQLTASGDVEAVVVVDDGSGPECRAIFEAAAAVEGVTVLRHVVNQGKGAALKSGIRYALATFPGLAGVVTADADGQHDAADILRIAQILLAEPDALVLGARTFSGEVPWRSRFGNLLTRSVLRAAIGSKLADTQTGLRGVPAALAAHLPAIAANGYEFELEMLLTCGDARREIVETGIETIYIDRNRGSHFNPLLDSMRVYFVFLRFAAVSMITAGIDNTVFLLLHRSWPSVIACQFASRAVAGVFNYSANKMEVFRSRTQNTVALPRYCVSVVAQGLVSYFLFTNLSRLLEIDVVIAKILVETGLFFR